MLARFKNLLGGASSRLSGRTDLLEAVCASAALIAAADGSIDDGEVVAALNVVKNNETLAGAFSATVIEQTMDKMLARAKGGFSGRAGLTKEINDVAAKGVDADNEVVYLIALDVAHADNNVGEAEKKKLTDIARLLGVNEAKFA